MCELDYYPSREDGELYEDFKPRANEQAKPLQWARDNRLRFCLTGIGEQRVFDIVMPSGMNGAAFEDLRLKFRAQLRIAEVKGLKASEFPPGSYIFTGVVFDDVNEVIKFTYAVDMGY